MNNKSVILSVLHIGVLLLFLFSCKKEEPATIPTVTIVSMTNVTASSASSGGEITSDGGITVTARGVCWSTNQNPSTTDNKTNDGSGSGSFTSSINGLTANITYYIRAYAINAAGTAYSNEISFITLSGLPILTTTPASSITFNSAISGGNIISNEGQEVFKRGVCWSTSPSPTINNDKTDDGWRIGSFTSSIIKLSPLTTYYIRAYATNGAGTAYGNEITIITLDDEPTLSSKTTIHYDSNWNKTEEVNYKWDLTAKGWVNYSKTAYSYDSKGLKTQSIYSLWDASIQKWINDSKSIFSYFAFGKMWLGINYYWDISTQNWISNYKNDNFNSSQGYLVYIRYNWENYHWVEYNSYKSEFTFDSKGRIKQQITTAYDIYQYGYYGAKSKIDFTYDSKGDIINSVATGWDSTYGWTDSGLLTSFTFDNNGNPTEKRTEVWSSNSGSYIKYSKTIYTYNSNGYQTEYIVYTN